MKISTIKSNRTINHIIPIIKNAVTFLFWVIIWQLIYVCVDNDILIASPLDVFYRLFDLSKDI